MACSKHPQQHQPHYLLTHSSFTPRQNLIHAKLWGEIILWKKDRFLFFVISFWDSHIVKYSVWPALISEDFVKCLHSWTLFWTFVFGHFVVTIHGTCEAECCRKVKDSIHCFKTRLSMEISVFLWEYRNIELYKLSPLWYLILKYCFGWFLHASPICSTNAKKNSGVSKIGT